MDDKSRYENNQALETYHAICLFADEDKLSVMGSVKILRDHGAKVIISFLILKQTNLTIHYNSKFNTWIINKSVFNFIQFYARVCYIEGLKYFLFIKVN